MRLTVRSQAQEGNDQNPERPDIVTLLRANTHNAANAVLTLSADAVEAPATVVGYLAGRAAGGVKRVMKATQNGWEGKPLAA